MPRSQPGAPHRRRRAPGAGKRQAILKANGFAAVRLWTGPGSDLIGEETQRFVGYNPKADCWISLDLALRLAVGPYRAFEPGADGGCLECRSWEDGVYVLGHDDAFWVLLLESLLDVPAPTDPLDGAPPSSGFVGLGSLVRKRGPTGRLLAW